MSQGNCQQTLQYISLDCFYKELFILVDLMCCGAILFPVVWYVVKYLSAEFVFKFTDNHCC